MKTPFTDAGFAAWTAATIALMLPTSLSASNDTPSVKVSDYDGKIADAAMVEALSKVPGKNELRATLLMLLKEPATRLARVLSEKAKKECGAPAEAAAPAEG